MPKMICGAALSAALAAFCLTSAYAAPLLNPADFQIIESPGQYKVINNSTNWYVYAFAVENPVAADSNIIATTDFHNWNGLTPNPQFDLNTGGPVYAFAYASQDTDFSTDPPKLSTVNLSNYIPPSAFSDRFFFGTDQVASHFGLLVVAVLNQETFFDDVNGLTTPVGQAPIPAALPLFAGGLGLIGFLARRKQQKQEAA